MRARGFLLPIIDIVLMLLLTYLCLCYLMPQQPLIEEKHLKISFKACETLYKAFYRGRVARALWGVGEPRGDELFAVYLNGKALLERLGWVHPFFYAAYNVSTDTREGRIVVFVRVGPS